MIHAKENPVTGGNQSRGYSFFHMCLQTTILGVPA
ncbi:hypothetical protein BCL93_105125 [Onishia taeanensis]|uniref:Uncharacterized protein n=1 Tax=Onishia taeanensis TaxID=284577 RepID=A0A328XPX4_9GAMM|nr:hypothetical protein BCL93_105125 [Halomonas taeanensis]